MVHPTLRFLQGIRVTTAGKQDSAGRKRLFAAGGLLGAILASTCCIAPLVLLTLGVSGAWMSNLTALAPYQSYFIAATLAFLAAGYWHVYFRPARSCDTDDNCGSPQSERIVKIALWLATALVMLALGINLVLPYFL